MTVLCGVGNLAGHRCLHHHYTHWRSRWLGAIALDREDRAAYRLGEGGRDSVPHLPVAVLRVALQGPVPREPLDQQALLDRQLLLVPDGEGMASERRDLVTRLLVLVDHLPLRDVRQMLRELDFYESELRGAQADSKT